MNHYNHQRVFLFRIFQAQLVSISTNCWYCYHTHTNGCIWTDYTDISVYCSKNDLKLSQVDLNVALLGKLGCSSDDEMIKFYTISWNSQRDILWKIKLVNAIYIWQLYKYGMFVDRYYYLSCNNSYNWWSVDYEIAASSTTPQYKGKNVMVSEVVGCRSSVVRALVLKPGFLISILRRQLEFFSSHFAFASL